MQGIIGSGFAVALHQNADAHVAAGARWIG